VLARPDKQLDYPTPRYRVDVTPSADGGRVIVTAETVVRDLLLQADRLGANASHELVTLLPGESYAWHVNGLGRALTRADCAAPVLLCAADVETRAKP
jgi:beta-mannosidase